MFLLILVLNLAHAAPVTATAGVEWTPFSRADTTWVDDGRTSGTGVGEFDGTVRPQMTAFAGVWFAHRWGLSGGIGLAQLRQSTWSDEVYLHRHWAVLRPHIDVRYSFIQRDKAVPIPWMVIGMHGTLPFAGETSNGFSEEESTQAERNGQVQRARLGGIGGRLGAGVDYGILPAVRIGFQFTGQWHRMVQKTSEAQLVHHWIGTQAALYLAFEWPKASKATP